MNDQPRGNWSSNMGLVLAATGSAIGLGNLWKFPFITWENNGGAFVLVYLVCIAGVGLPIMLAELLIGRRSQKSVVGALREAAGPAWGVAGGWGVLCGFILLSYYTVIAGWSLFYFWQSAGWTLGGFPADLVAGDLFNEQVSTAGLQFIALFALLETLPLATVSSFLGLVLVVVFFVTSSDSGSLVIDTITAGGKLDTPIAQRAFWCIFEGFVAIALLLGGGLVAAQAAILATGLPLALVLAAMCYSTWQGLRASTTEDRAG